MRFFEMILLLSLIVCSVSVAFIKDMITSMTATLASNTITLKPVGIC